MEAKYASIAETPAAMQLHSFLRYAGAGLIGTAAHFIVLFAALNLVGPVVASSFGAIVGCIINYALSREFVFFSTTAMQSSFPRFATVALLGIVINALLIGVLVGTLPVAFSQVIASGTVLSFGYVANKNWSFNGS
jgi:putative flippase GtrA